MIFFVLVLVLVSRFIPSIYLHNSKAVRYCKKNLHLFSTFFDARKKPNNVMHQTPYSLRLPVVGDDWRSLNPRPPIAGGKSWRRFAGYRTVLFFALFQPLARSCRKLSLPTNAPFLSLSGCIGSRAEESANKRIDANGYRRSLSILARPHTDPRSFSFLR
jgi:hypothetical protein